MSDTIAKAGWETLFYFLFGTPLTAAAWAFAICLISPVILLRGFDRAAAFIRQSGLFAAILLLYGAAGNVVFTLALRDRYYYAADPIVDWLPWLPDPFFPLDVSCGGHFMNGATAWTILTAWVVVALPVWAATVMTFRRIQASPDLRV
jgi:hypothetical protein